MVFNPLPWLKATIAAVQFPGSVTTMACEILLVLFKQRLRLFIPRPCSNFYCQSSAKSSWSLSSSS
ncbi:hypothetical protein P3L10_027789 [Capsicum annuum]